LDLHNFKSNFCSQEGGSERCFRVGLARQVFDAPTVPARYPVLARKPSEDMNCGTQTARVAHHHLTGGAIEGHGRGSVHTLLKLLLLKLHSDPYGYELTDPLVT
jgi:hypothetical protein